MSYNNNNKQELTLFNLIRQYTFFGIPIFDLIIGYVIFHLFYDHHQAIFQTKDYKILISIIPIVIVINYIIDPVFRSKFKDPNNYYMMKFLFIVTVLVIVL
jgi:surface polysaccharide O-acyltransferase-like enzyme